MKQSYDVIVVGAGPSGSMAAFHAVKNGASVLLLEKDREIGLPVRCAEGVGEKGLSAVIEIQPHWIAQKICGVMLYSPSGRAVEMPSKEVGYVLHRKIFDWELAQMAAKTGADVVTKAYVYDLIKSDGRVAGVRLRHLGKEYQISCNIVIGADGVESRVGRWAGLATRTAMKDMETCAQVTAERIDVDPNLCHFYFSEKIAPGGYLWIFPKGHGVANIGLGISGIYAHRRPAIDYLMAFLAAKFPNAAILTIVAGGVPCAVTLKEITTDGLMLVGDAAHQVNPVSGGGIVSGMFAGKLAGQIAAQAVAAQDFSNRRLQEYAKLWHRSVGKEHRIFHRLKEYIYKLTDSELEHIASLVLDVPIEKRTLFQLFKAGLYKKPSLIIDAIKVFATQG